MWETFSRLFSQPDILFIVVGLFCLLVAGVGKIENKMDPGLWGRVFLGILGAVLLAAGSIMYFRSPKPAPAATDGQKSCEIVATSGQWDPPGSMGVSIDKSPIGVFRYGPWGSESLQFPCTTGQHTFTFSIEGTSTTCSGSIYVHGNSRFRPGNHVQGTEVQCFLVEQ